MAVKTVIVCDECGTHKGAVNHWFMTSLPTDNRFEAACFDASTQNEWPTHLCGQTCAAKVFTRWMTLHRTYQE